MHFGANYIEPAAIFDGRCSFWLIAKNESLSHLNFWYILAVKSPFLVVYIMIAHES